jgi:mRNA interferase MazF
LLPDHKPWPFAVNLEPTQENSLDKARHINLKQLRAVDASRIGKLQGKLDKRHLPAIRNALAIVFDW